MARKAFVPEQIINRLWEDEILLSQGDTSGEASRKIGVTDQPTIDCVIRQHKCDTFRTRANGQSGACSCS